MKRTAGTLLSLGALLSAQTVRIVDATTGGPGSLQTGVNASSAGDVLRVRPGTYSPTTVRLGLHILCEPGATCHQLIAQGIPVGQTLTIVGLDLVGIPGTDNRFDHAPLRVEACSGKVVFAAATVRGRQDTVLRAPPLTFPRPAPAVRVEGADLHCIDATLVGVDGGLSEGSVSQPWDTSYWLGTPAVAALGATVTFSRCALTGGHGGMFRFWDAAVCAVTSGNGGAGALGADASLAVMDRSVLTGGTGGDAWVLQRCNWCGPNSVPRPGAGGVAVGASNGATLVGLGPSRLTAGASGTSPCAPSTPSPAIDGSAFDVYLDPAVTLVPGAGAVPIRGASQVTTRVMASMVSQAVRAAIGTPVGWTHHDQPGAFAFFLPGSGMADWIPHPAVLGGVHLDPTLSFIQGPLLVPGTGALPFGFTLPADPTLRGGRLFVQTIGIDNSLQAVGSAPSALFVDF